MKGVCHASFATVRKFLRDVVGVKICRGQLAKLIGKVSESLDTVARLEIVMCQSLAAFSTILYAASEGFVTANIPSNRTTRI